MHLREYTAPAPLMTPPTTSKGMEGGSIATTDRERVGMMQVAAASATALVVGTGGTLLKRDSGVGFRYRLSQILYVYGEDVNGTECTFAEQKAFHQRCSRQSWNSELA